jgi:hypothetical protein
MSKPVTPLILWKIRSAIATKRLFLNEAHRLGYPPSLIADFRKALLDLEMCVLACQIKLNASGHCPGVKTS